MSLSETTRRDPRTERAPAAPHSLYHESFEDPDARERYDPAGAPDVAGFADKYMPDEVTRDYARRMREFFDHHLMGKPAPAWLKEGVPHLKMDEHLEERSKGS